MTPVAEKPPPRVSQPGPLRGVRQPPQTLGSTKDFHNFEDPGRGRGTCQSGPQGLRDLTEFHLFLLRKLADGRLQRSRSPSRVRLECFGELAEQSLGFR